MKLLIGVDDSAASRHAIEVAFEFFGSSAEYTIASVGMVQPVFSTTLMGGTFTSANDVTARFDIAERAAGEQARAAAATVPVDAHVDVDAAVGHPGRVLCDIAASVGADAIVIGSRDSTAWERLLAPSTGRYLIDHAPCPVVVVR